MGFFKKNLILGLFLLSISLSAEIKERVNYLVHNGDLNQALEIYEKYYKDSKKHDPEILERLALSILDQGSLSNSPEKSLLSIYGSGIAGIQAPHELLEQGIHSHNVEAQLTSLQFLSNMQDKTSDDILIKAMSSDFLETRMEAAYLLAIRKHEAATGQVESLMYKLPPQLKFLFPEFFAMIGSNDAIFNLKHMMEDKDTLVRIEAILCAANHQRDDLLPSIRKHLTHSNAAEQEVSAAAVGFFKDSKSIPTLKKLLDSPSRFAKISAAKALIMLGDPDAEKTLLNQAKNLDCFAIAQLGEVQGSEDILSSLLFSNNLDIKLNAATSLLKRRDPRCQNEIIKILLSNSQDKIFVPQISPGRSLLCWSSSRASKEAYKMPWFDPQALSLSFKEQILRSSIELPEENFLFIAEKILNSERTELIPLTIHLIENLKSPAAVALLEKNFQKIGAPLARAYCNLALFKLKTDKEVHEKLLKEWVLDRKNVEMIKFRKSLPRDLRLKTNFELTAEENSRLLIESCLALAESHEEKYIEILLDVMKSGHPSNKYVVAGILLKALQ